MSTVFALKLVCDICFYLAFAGVVGGYLGGGDVMPAVPLFAVAAWAMGALHRRGRSVTPALLLLPVCLLAAWGSWVNLVILIPPVVYGVHCAMGIDRYFGKLHYGSTFSLFLKAYGPFALAVLVVGGGSVLEAASLPYGVLFLFGAVVLMRMLRHDPEVIAQPRFQAVNALLVAVVLPVGWLLGSRTALSLVKSSLGFVYFQVIAPLLLLLANLLAYLLFPLLALLDVEGGGNPLPDDSVADANGDFLEQFGDGNTWGDAVGRILLAVLAVAAVAGVVYVVIRLFRRLADDRAEKPSATGIRQTRTTLPGRSNRRRAGEERLLHPVRRAYRTFLLACKKGGLSLQPHHTSGDVERYALEAFGQDETVAQIRALYLPVRYGEASSKESAKRMKALCKEFQQGIDQT